MNSETLKNILEQVQAGDKSINQAVEQLRQLPFESMGYAHLDHHRALRCGMPEAIYCPGKSIVQIVEIFANLARAGGNVLATRADKKTYEAVAAHFPQARYEELARAIVLRQETPAKDDNNKQLRSSGYIAIVTAGTSDINVAEEARITAEMLNQDVKTIYDVGVAGLHRLLSHCQQLQKANVIVVVAGMEGALASVVGGLVAVPVIAVPTSVGYGASFAGVAPLLTMLNSCAAGVSVVNIDNGFAAGYIAGIINQRTRPTEEISNSET